MWPQCFGQETLGRIHIPLGGKIKVQAFKEDRKMKGIVEESVLRYLKEHE